jgi:predicted RNA-binding protein
MAFSIEFLSVLPQRSKQTKKQKMSSIALRNMRTLTRKEDYYTPSKVETNTAYKLNEKKALMKKIDAGKRDLDVEIELKRGTLVITYTPAAYEIYKPHVNDIWKVIINQSLIVSTIYVHSTSSIEHIYSIRIKGLRVAINVSTKMTKVKLSYITIEPITVIEMK